MNEETQTAGGKISDYLDSNERRQFLKYLSAGALGGTMAAGIDGIFGDGVFGRLTGTPEEFRRRYDVLVRERDFGYEAIDAGGGTIDAGNDGWSVLQNGIDAVPDGGSIYVDGRYQSTSTIVARKSISMHGPDSTIEQQQPGEFVFRFKGTERYETSITEPATTGDNTVELKDTSGIRKGGMILVVDSNGDPVLGRGKPPGEPHSVLEVDGSTVRLEDSIVWRDDYPEGTLAYVIDPVEVHVSGFDLVSPAKDENYYGIMAHLCRDSSFEDLWLEKFGSRGLLLEGCANFRVRDCTVLQSSDIEANDGYGIQVWSGCHDIIVEGCAVKECRHPLSVTPGGDRSVASRAITFRDCFVTANGAGALNCHGGSAHNVRFEGCTVHTWESPGVVTGAQRTNVSGCEFRMDGYNAIGTRGDGQERIVTVSDTDIFGATNAVKLNQEEDWNFTPLWKLVDLDNVRAYGCEHFFTLGGGEIDRVRDLAIKGCYWDTVSEGGVRLLNQLDSGIIEGNDLGEAPTKPHIIARGGSNNGTTGLQVLGNEFTKSTGNREFIRLAQSTQCVISNNRFDTESSAEMYVDGPNSSGNLIAENTYYGPNPPSDLVAENAGSMVRNNEVYDTVTDSWR